MAMELKQELDYINVITEKQKIELHDLVDRDVINYYVDNGFISIEIIMIRHGKLLNHYNKIYPIDTDIEDEMESFIVYFYGKNEIPREILIPESLNSENLSKILETTVLIPQKGLKKDLIKMAYDNAKLNLNNKFEEINKDEERTTKANDELKEVLHMDILDRIDIFDNSNLFGDFSVSGMVVFKDGKPAKSEYRKYKVSFEKNDDYNTMREIIYRRYQRAMVDNTEIPDLIIVDGGENQIKAAYDSLNLLHLDIRVVGLKKNDHHRTNDLIDSDLSVIELNKNSNLFHYLTRMQD
jgi:excinuclease ABC subunit C